MIRICWLDVSLPCEYAERSFLHRRANCRREDEHYCLRDFTCRCVAVYKSDMPDIARFKKKKKKKKKKEKEKKKKKN